MIDFKNFDIEEDCHCMTPPFHSIFFEIKSIGLDITNDRYGEVSLQRCRKCKSLWLVYFVEYEAFSKSGRWFRGLISEEDAKTMESEDAANYLEKIDWCFYGGSYFKTSGDIRNDHHIPIDL